MLDLDQRVADGLRELASRAPADADVWPAAERHVTRRRRRRRSLGAGIVVIALVGVGVATAAVVRSGPPKAVVATPGGRLPAKGPVDGSFTITASPTGRVLRFSPSSVTVRTGVYAITLVDGSNGTHSLAFDNPATLSSRGLIVSDTGERKTARVFFGRPGDYLFYCTVPGHRIAGEQGVVHVTGSAVTLAQAISDGRP